MEDGTTKVQRNAGKVSTILIRNTNVSSCFNPLRKYSQRVETKFSPYGEIFLNRLKQNSQPNETKRNLKGQHILPPIKQFNKQQL